MEIFCGANLACGGGGRYDNLIRSLGGPQLPAVGISFGVDRLMDLLSEKQVEIPVEAYVIPIGKVEKEAFFLTGKLREAGFKAEMDVMKRNLSKNLASVNARNIPFVLFLGEDELAQNQVKVRDMASGEEKLVELAPFGKLKEFLAERLGKNEKKD
jgi:histidyl-tRNA synthetase